MAGKFYVAHRKPLSTVHPHCGRHGRPRSGERLLEKVRLVLASESDLERYGTRTTLTGPEINGLDLMAVQPRTDVVHGCAKGFSGPFDPDD
jgi:hypothetical protein